MIKYYLNLTNGIEAFESMSSYLYNCGFIRIQSTMCEQKNWDRIIQELEYDFLLNLAMGNYCIVIDFGANKPIPRALYQGIEFIRYVLYKRWYNINTKAIIKKTQNSRENDCTKYFEECYNKLDDRTKKKLDYLKPFLNENKEILLKIRSDATIHDGDREYYKKLLYECNK